MPKDDPTDYTQVGASPSVVGQPWIPLVHNRSLEATALPICLSISSDV